MSGDVHVQFCESLWGKFPWATHRVILCKTEEEAKRALEEMKGMFEAGGLTLHPEKTKIIDATQEGGFDFLGYHFERGMRWPRKKGMDKLKEAIRHKTRRTSGEGMKCIIGEINKSLRGWYEYFKHSYKMVFPRIDSWIRMRLRSILRKRRGGKGRGRGADQQRWPNAYFANIGLFTITAAHELACQSRRGNHWLESRMREIRLYGSEGGEVKTFPTPISSQDSDINVVLHAPLIRFRMFFKILNCSKVSAVERRALSLNIEKVAEGRIKYQRFTNLRRRN